MLHILVSPARRIIVLLLACLFAMNFAEEMEAWPMLVQLFEEKDINIIVVGGSQAAGVKCYESSAIHSQSCSWTARFASWVKIYYHAKVNYVNLARGGMTSCSLLTMFASLRKLLSSARGASLLIIDFAVNDAHQQKTSLSIVCMERFIRELYSFGFFSRVRIMLVSGIYLPAVFDKRTAELIDVSAGYEKLARHYQVALLDFNSLLVASGKMSIDDWYFNGTAVYPDSRHPSYKMHILFSEIAQNQVLINRKSVRSDVKYVLPIPLSKQKALSAMGICVNYRSEFDTYRLINSTFWKSGVKVMHGQWRLLEDIPGKPGIISTSIGSELRIPVSFGKRPSLTISYMTSYEGFGSAELRFPKFSTNSYLLVGHRPHKKVSQVVTEWLSVNKKIVQANLPGTGVVGFKVKPFSNTYLLLRLTGGRPLQCKFKLVHVGTC